MNWSLIMTNSYKKKTNYIYMILNKLLRNNSEIDEKKINILSKSNFSKNIYKRWVEYPKLLSTDIIKVYENENLEKIIQL